MFYFTLQVADVSNDNGVTPVDDKHVGIVVPAVHALDDPHLQIEPVHVLSSTEGDPHAVADPHLQVPEVQVSEFPLHITPKHRTKKIRVIWSNKVFSLLFILLQEKL